MGSAISAIKIDFEIVGSGTERVGQGVGRDRTTGGRDQHLQVIVEVHRIGQGRV